MIGVSALPGALLTLTDGAAQRTRLHDFAGAGPCENLVARATSPV